MSTKWYVDSSNTAADGLLGGFDSQLQAFQPISIRGDIKPLKIHVLERDPNSAQTGNIYRHKDITGATLKVSIGSPDAGPQGGYCKLSYAGNINNSNNITATSTAAQVQACLNAISGLNLETTVYGGNGEYLVVFSGAKGARTLLAVGDTNLLVPATSVFVQRTVTGDASTYEQQTISLLALNYAETDTWTVASDSATGTVTLTDAGSATTKAIVTVALPTNAIGGSGRLTFARAQTWTLNCIANHPVAQRWSMLVGNATPANYQNLFLDTEDNAGVVRFWFKYNGAGTAPTTPPGGRLMFADLVTADNTVALIASRIQAAFAANVQFASTYIFGPTDTLMVVNSTAGTRAAPTVTGTLSGYVTLEVVTAGDNGALAGTHLATLADSVGTVALWLNVHNDVEPDHGCFRSIEILTALTTAALLRDVIKTLVEVDTEFTTGNGIGGSQFTATCVTNGAFDSGTQPDSGFGVTVTTVGSNIAGEFSYNVSATTLQDLFTDWTVTNISPFTFRFVALANGVWTAPSIANNFTVPQYFTGTLGLNQAALVSAFALLDVDTDPTIDAILEIELTETDGGVSTILYVPTTISRDSINASSLISSVIGTTLDTTVFSKLEILARLNMVVLN